MMRSFNASDTDSQILSDTRELLYLIAILLDTKPGTFASMRLEGFARRRMTAPSKEDSNAGSGSNEAP